MQSARSPSSCQHGYIFPIVRGADVTKRRVSAGFHIDCAATMISRCASSATCAARQPPPTTLHACPVMQPRSRMPDHARRLAESRVYVSSTAHHCAWPHASAGLHPRPRPSWARPEGVRTSVLLNGDGRRRLLPLGPLLHLLVDRQAVFAPLHRLRRRDLAGREAVLRAGEDGATVDVRPLVLLTLKLAVHDDLRLKRRPAQTRSLSTSATKLKERRFAIVAATRQPIASDSADKEAGQSLSPPPWLALVTTATAPATRLTFTSETTRQITSLYLRAPNNYFNLGQQNTTLPKIVSDLATEEKLQRGIYDT